MIITKVVAREILDSRGIPTISTTIWLDDGSCAKGEVPSGSSTGEFEVLELRDSDPKRYGGKGVLKAVDIVNTKIAKAIVGKNFTSQEELDNFLIELDGTKQKKVLGGNSILSVSMAFCRATSISKGVPLYQYFGEISNQTTTSLPTPMILIMEGAKHGNWSTDFQEYMIVPQQGRFSSFTEMLRGGAEVFAATHDVLTEMQYNANVGFEGAYTPDEIKGNQEAFDIILKGIEKAGYKPEIDFKIAIDIAASEFFNKETRKYELHKEGSSLTWQEWLDTLVSWMEKYPICSIEDPFDQEDWETWVTFTSKVGNKYQIVGDDLLCTNVERIQKSVQMKACNAALIKLNQIGTVTEALRAITLGKQNGMGCIISHRGGETNDDMIADMVVGTNAGQSKFGGPDRGERLAKYNRLIEIEGK